MNDESAIVAAVAAATLTGAGQARDIVAIGASAGGIPALRTLVGALPADFPGSLFIVVHISPDATSDLAGILGRAGALPASAPSDMARIEPGNIYVSSPNYHMLVERDRIRIVHGPKENRHRPAVDPLFRSVAWAYGPRAVGVVLSGNLDDGTAGLWAIKSSGGVTVVQDPGDALRPGMPESALAFNEVDHVLPVAEIGPLLARLATENIPALYVPDPPSSMKTEIEFQMMDHDRDIKDMGRLGHLSPFTCPSCRGTLWELREGDHLRYRCHTGHAYSGDSLLAEQTTTIEDGLYAALRAVEEKSVTLRRLGSRHKDRYPRMEADYMAKADEMDESAKVLRRIIAAGRF